MGPIVVVIPAFDEADAIGRLLGRLPRQIDGMAVRPLVVSDGSSDGTAMVADACGAQVLSSSRNFGKASALRRGIRAARREGAHVVVTMDADGQHDPSELELVVRPVLAGDCDIAIGSRYLADPRRGRAPLNRFLVRSATVAWLRRVLGRTYRDPYSGFRALSPEALDHLSLAGDRYQAELEQLFDAAMSGLRVLEVPVGKRYGPRTSKMGVRSGRLLGRLRVLGQYTATLVRRTREVRTRRGLVETEETYV